jgi:zinc transport system substrate-binding protein
MKVRTVLVPILGTALIALGATACSRGNTSTGGRISVVAAFFPLQEAASRIGGNLVAVTNLTAPGIEPHDIELTPDQLRSIASSDLVLYLGGGFQPAVQNAVGQASGSVVDVSQGLRSLPVPPGESADQLVADPHVWLDPVLYGQIVDRVAQALSAVDPSHATIYHANAARFDRQVAGVDEAYRTGLAHCERQVIVTSHAAFGYLATRYGLTQEPISGLSPDVEPTPQDLVALKALVERDHITTIFTEELVSPKVAETLANETGTTTAVLNPLESLTPDEVAAGDDYVSVMDRNLQILRSALACS